METENLFEAIYNISFNTGKKLMGLRTFRGQVTLFVFLFIHREKDRWQGLGCVALHNIR